MTSNVHIEYAIVPPLIDPRESAPYAENRSIGWSQNISIRNIYSVMWPPHRGRMTHISIGKKMLAFISSDKGVSHFRRQVIIRTNAGLLSFWVMRYEFSCGVVKRTKFLCLQINFKRILWCISIFLLCLSTRHHTVWWLKNIHIK